MLSKNMFRVDGLRYAQLQVYLQIMPQLSCPEIKRLYTTRTSSMNFNGASGALTSRWEFCIETF